jgi:hypothetical protein
MKIPPLIDGVMVLGDQAFQSSVKVIAPYPPITQIQNVDAVSKGRMCSEHGIGIMKQWGFVRGRILKVFIKLNDDN